MVVEATLNYDIITPPILCSTTLIVFVCLYKYACKMWDFIHFIAIISLSCCTTIRLEETIN